MRRITITLPDDLAAAVEREARRRRCPVSRLCRETLAGYLGWGSTERRELPFAALGRSGHHNTARDFEAILEAEWGNAGGR